MIKIVRNGEKMEKNIYKYSMEIIGIDIPDKPLKISFKEEFENLLDFLMKMPKKHRRKELVDKDKVMYLEMYKKSDIKDINIYYLKFVSVKYNQAREVLNKDTLESRGRLKKITDGDKEYNHIVVIEKNNKINVAFEYNYYGMQNLGTIVSYFNDFIILYFENLHKRKYYYLEAYNEVNKDFIEELNKMTKITAATIVVESRRLGNTQFGILAGREDIKDEIEITFKKNKKANISKDIIKKYYSNKDGGIKRIYVSGRNPMSRVKLDTEEMKQREKISVGENKFGEVDSDEMFEKLKNYLLGENQS